MAQGKSSAKDVTRRLKVLVEIIEECYRQGMPVTNQILLAKLAERRLHISSRQLFRDRTTINQENSFLADLGESNYSAYLEEIKNNLDLVEKESWEQYQKTWMTRKVIKRKVPDKDGSVKEITEQQAIENDAIPKAKFLEIFAQCQQTKLNMLKGDNLNIAVELLSKKMHEVKEERDGLKLQLERFKHNASSN